MIKNKKFKSVGIVGFGAYLPYWRIGIKEIACYWGLEVERVWGLGAEQKTVASLDEDCLTMAVEASLTAIKRAGISPREIGAVFVGSESHPYAVKPTGTILADILGIGNDYFCVDLQFACKAATAGLQIVGGMIESGMIDYGLVVGSDKAQARPGDVLEYMAGAGAGAFVLGKKKEAIVDLLGTYSFCSDTPDFWRRQRCQYPTHAGRFTGEPGYFYHLEHCLKKFLKRINKKAKDFDYVVFHMPNTRFPLKIGKKFKFKPEQIGPGFLVPKIGNPYAASSLLGLISTLEQAEKDKNILLVSYGSGAGSDAFWLRTNKKMKRAKGKTIKKYLTDYQGIDYGSYLSKGDILR